MSQFENCAQLIKSAAGAGYVVEQPDDAEEPKSPSSPYVLDPPKAIVKPSEVASTFNSIDEFCQAMELYSSNPSEAKSKYGPLLQWDISLMEEMAGAEKEEDIKLFMALQAFYINLGIYGFDNLIYKEYFATNAPLAFDHGDSLANLYKICVFYDMQGKYELAEIGYGICMDTIMSAQKFLAKCHLAFVYLKQGKHELAQTLIGDDLKTIVAEEIRSDDKDHSLIHSLAIAFEMNGVLDLAKSLFEVCLSYRRQKFGSAHPDTTTAVHHLGMLNYSLGNYLEAKALFKECFENRKELFGDCDLDALQAMESFAYSLEALSELEAAKSLYEDILALKKHLLGDEDPETLTAMNSLANVLTQLPNQFELAYPYYATCVEKRKKVLGEMHPDTLTSMFNLATFLSTKENYSEAQLLFEECLEKRVKTLGEDHPHTIYPMESLAWLFETQEKYELAQLWYEKCVEKRKAIFGDFDPETVTSIQSLAILYEKQGKNDLAQALQANLKIE